MKAFVFPGQGAQFPGMGKDFYEKYEIAKRLFEQANEILGFSITDIMFGGSEEELRQTKVTQPAIFLHSVISSKIMENEVKPDMVAGHSLGEFSALVANNSLSFKDGLRLVYQRALAMQKACEIQPSTMAAILGLDDSRVEEILNDIKDEIVVPANYNSPGQIVISGSMEGVARACDMLKDAGAKRTLPLKVGGAFHSPFMEPARIRLAQEIENTFFKKPTYPIYQNVDALPHTDETEIKNNLISQLTSPVRWTQIVENMVKDGAKEFVEHGPGNILQGLIKKITGCNIETTPKSQN